MADDDYLARWGCKKVEIPFGHLKRIVGFRADIRIQGVSRLR
jgi:hypothetical protein